MTQTRDKAQDHNYVFKCLSCFKSIKKYERVHEHILLYGKSAYIIGEHIKGKVEFFKREFEDMAQIPFSAMFEDSSNIKNPVINSDINTINTLARTYCDTLFYIDRYEVLRFMSDNYNSQAKLNKITLTIDPVPVPKFNFKPVKRSVSVFESEYIINKPVKISPNARLSAGCIQVNAMHFYEVLNNDLFSRIVKVEINKGKSFIRLSCISDGVKIKFIINERRNIKNKK